MRISSFLSFFTSTLIGQKQKERKREGERWVLRATRRANFFHISDIISRYLKFHPTILFHCCLSFVFSLYDSSIVDIDTRNQETILSFILSFCCTIQNIFHRCKKRVSFSRQIMKGIRTSEESEIMTPFVFVAVKPFNTEEQYKCSQDDSFIWKAAYGNFRRCRFIVPFASETTHRGIIPLYTYARRVATPGDLSRYMLARTRLD